MTVFYGTVIEARMEYKFGFIIANLRSIVRHSLAGYGNNHYCKQLRFICSACFAYNSRCTCTNRTKTIP